MPVYNHHTPYINISQYSRINTIHPSSEPCHNPWRKTTKHCERPQIEHLHFATTSLAGDRRNTCQRSTSVNSYRSRSVNRRALPPCTCRKPWLTQIKSTSYITHRAMPTPTATSFADSGASRHTWTSLQIHNDSQSLHLHEPNCRFTASTQY